MSNISQASKNIKKKLSFDDYSKPNNQNTIEPAHNDVVVPAEQSAITTSMPAEQSVSCTGKHVVRQTSKAAKKSAVSASKVKATFYLADEENQMLTDIFIKRLQEKNKTDKSALISEAIYLLYKREMK